MGLNPQPIISIETADGIGSPTPWDQTSQLVTASLKSINGTKLRDVTKFLKGNLTADASSGIAHFTDLDVSRADQGYKLQFSLAPDWNVQALFTGAFSIKAGPASLVNVAVEPAYIGTTTQPLDPQPVIELIDTYGNFNPDTLDTLVTATIKPDDPSAFLGWTPPELPGRTKGNIVTTDRGRASFTELALYGLGVWHIEFQAVLNFRTVTARSAGSISLRQLDSPSLKFIFAVDYDKWSSADEAALLETLVAICKLDVAALEVLDRSANEVGGRRSLLAAGTVAQVAIHVPDPSPYFQMIAADLNSESSALKALGVYVVEGPGIKIENEMPDLAPPAEVLEEYEGIPFDMVELWSESAQALTISGYLVLASLVSSICLPSCFSLPPTLSFDPHVLAPAHASTMHDTYAALLLRNAIFAHRSFDTSFTKVPYAGVTHVAVGYWHGSLFGGSSVICSRRTGL